MNENNIKYSSAGNLISLTMDNSFNIINLSIDESLLVKDQKELLEEMISSSINEAILKVKDLKKDENDGHTCTSNNENHQTNPFNINFEDMGKIFNDISKMTSVEFKDGKPVMNISLDSISPDMISKMSNIINELNNKKDDDKE